MENSRDFSDLKVKAYEGAESGDTPREEIDFEDTPKKALKKGEKAKLLVQKSLELKSSVESELERVEDEILDDIEQLEEKREEFLDSTFREGKEILEKFKFEYPTDNENSVISDLSLDRRVDDIDVKDISTGAFSGFILALLSMLGVIGGTIYAIANQLGIDLKLENFPDVNIDQSALDKIFEYISNLVLGESNPDYGMAILGGVALIVGFIVYKIRVILKENKNYKEANRIYEETNLYVQHLREQIEDFKRVGEHIKSMIPLIDDYKYILNENIAKLKRALHVEGEREDYKDYHSTTVDTLKGTKRLMKQIEELLTTPVIKSGRLTQESALALSDTKNVYEYFLSKIYN